MARDKDSYPLGDDDLRRVTDGTRDIPNPTKDYLQEQIGRQASFDMGKILAKATAAGLEGTDIKAIVDAAITVSADMTRMRNAEPGTNSNKNNSEVPVQNVEDDNKKTDLYLSIIKAKREKHSQLPRKTQEFQQSAIELNNLMILASHETNKPAGYFEANTR